MNIYDPAFPELHERGEWSNSENRYIPHYVTVPGMTKLEWFAGMALQGMLAYSHVNLSTGNFIENCTIEDASRTAFAYAEAMVTEANRISKP